MARTDHVPDLEPSAPTWRGRWGLLVSQAQAHPNQAWDLFPGSGAKVLARAGLSGFHRPALELGSQGIDSFLLEKRRGGSYYLTQPARRHRAMIENSTRKMRPKETTAPKFVCTVTFILFVFVWAWMCTHASLIYSMVVLASHTLWAKEGCNLHFCAHVQEQRQINISI